MTDKTLREAAQMAIDALQEPLGFTGSRQIDAILNKAIKDLRAALALPDEPSMVVAFDEGVKEPRIVSWSEHPTGTHLMYSTARPAPLERQPLNELEAQKAFNAWDFSDVSHFYKFELHRKLEVAFMDGLRAGEALHDIKGAA